MKNNKKNKLCKALCSLLLLVMMFTLTQINMVSAANWDNVGDYNEETRTMTITNLFGFGSVIANITLLTPYVVWVEPGEERLVAEFKIDNYQTNTEVLEELKFYNSNNLDVEIGKVFQYQRKKIDEVIMVDTYEMVCNDETPIVCYNEIVGQHEQNVYDYQRFDTETEIGVEEITLGIFADVKPRNNIEWIPKIYGVEIKEWASFIDAIQQEFYTADFDTSQGAQGIAMEFTIGTTGSGGDFNLAGITLKYFAAPTVTAGGCNYTLWSGALDGTPIKLAENITDCSEAGGADNWVNISLDYGSDILDAGVYTISITGAGADHNMAAPGGDSYAGGHNFYSTNNGQSWTAQTAEDLDFIIWGTAPNIFPEVTLTAPANQTLQESDSLDFNCTATDADGTIASMDLIIDDVVNFTASDNNITKTLSLGDGVYLWKCNATDDEADTNSSETRSFTIDSTYPEVNITYPINNSAFAGTSPYNVSLNFTASDTNLAYCWYHVNNTVNVSLTCGTNTSILLTAGYHNITYYANDTLGHTSSSNSNFYINIISENFSSFTDPAIQGESYTYSVNITPTLLNTYNGSLFYNGTERTTTISNLSNVITLTATGIEALNVGNVSFYFQYDLNGNRYNTTFYSHMVYAIPAPTVLAGSSCTAGLDKSLYYDFKNEQNDSILNVTSNYIFRYGISNNTLQTQSGTIIAPNFSVCINSTIYNNYSLGYGEIQYSYEGYSSRRFYMFEGQRISNVTISNTLYNLLSGSSTSFLFTVQRGDLSPYDNNYVTLNRWYPESDQYKVVEMSSTDDEGQTVMKVEIEDVDYRVGVYDKDGTLIYLAAAIRLVCIATPCTYSLTVPEDAGASFEDWRNLQVSLDFDIPTNIFTLIYNDPSQETDTINLTVYKELGTHSLNICTDSETGYTGVLTCDVTGHTGLLRAVATRKASPETSIITKMVNLGSATLGKTPALFITLLIMILLVMIGVVSPILTVILAVLAFIPAMLFGIMPLPILLIIAAMGFIVIHFMKRSVT